MPLSKIQAINGQVTPNLGRRNLVVNGAAEVYQRGASATAHNSYSVDRWQLKNTSGATCTHQQVTDSPAPFKNSVRYSAGGTSCTAAQVAGIAQRMEGTYTLPLGWGTSAAKPCTLSFWVKSSVTGTYAVSTRNNDTDSSFVNTYTINSANTWEHKTVTFSAQTAGTWLNTTGIGVRLWWDLGSGDNFNADATGQWRSSANYLTVSNQADVVGTSGALWYLTGVQLEVGNTSTDFEHRSVGEELSLCQRYCYQHMAANGGGGGNSTEDMVCTAACYDTNTAYGAISLPVTMRAAPTIDSHGGTNYWKFYNTGGVDTFNTFAIINATTTSVQIYNNQHIGISAGDAGNFQGGHTDNYIRFIAEL
jgi:hypothetical protein